MRGSFFVRCKYMKSTASTEAAPQIMDWMDMKIAPECSVLTVCLFLLGDQLGN